MANVGSVGYCCAGGAQEELQVARLFKGDVN